MVFVFLLALSSFAQSKKVQCVFGSENFPGIKPGEVFINTTTKAKFSSFKWKTKRLGKVAYVCEGADKKLKEYPLFVAKEEFIRSQIINSPVRILTLYLLFGREKTTNKKPTPAPVPTTGNPF